LKWFKSHQILPRHPKPTHKYPARKLSGTQVSDAQDVKEDCREYKAGRFNANTFGNPSESNSMFDAGMLCGTRSEPSRKLPSEGAGGDGSKLMTAELAANSNLSRLVISEIKTHSDAVATRLNMPVLGKQRRPSTGRSS
jgi:hypothetical protein